MTKDPPAGPARPGKPPPEPQPHGLMDNLRLVWRLRHHYGKYLLPTVGLIFLALLQADLALTATTAGQTVIDRFAAPDAPRIGPPGGGVTLSESLFTLLAGDASVVGLALLMALFLVLSQGLGIAIEQIRTMVTERFRLGVQTKLIDGLSRELAASRGRRSSGNTAQIFTSDAAQLSGLLIFGIVGALENLVKAGVYAYGLSRIPDGWVIVAIALPLTLLFQTLVARFFISYEARQIQASEGLNVRMRSFSTEFFDVLDRLVYFRGEASQGSRLLDLSLRSARASRQFQLLSSVQGAVMGILTTLSLPIVVALVSLPVLVAVVGGPGTISAGTIVQAQALLMLLTTTTSTLVSLPSRLSQMSPSIRRVEEILEIPEPEPRPPELDRVLRSGRAPTLRLENVTFRYPGTATDILRNVDLEIPAGSRIALVAGSGGGKSTLARVLLGDQRVTSGRILFDDVDITDWHLFWRRELIGFLPAEQGWLRGTLEENVLFGRSRESARDFEHALDVSGVAGIAERKLPEGGLQFMIDNRPDDVLSTGERRRIGIARLLIGDQPLWIFDEPGAGLDQKEMGRVAQALVEATRSRTSIIITHDPDVFITDFVIFLVAGGVEAVGTHAELLDRNDEYRRLVERFVHEREEQADAITAPPPAGPTGPRPPGPPPTAGSGKVKTPVPGSGPNDR